MEKQIIALSTTHGKSKSHTYSIWKGIRKRCLNKKEPSFTNYGGRGISICKRWNKYENFLADMSEAPPGMTIERKNNDGNYEPNNCIWADKITQMNNMRTNIFIKFKGETMTLKQWSRKLGISYHRLYQRIYRLSWTIKKTFT